MCVMTALPSVNMSELPCGPFSIRLHCVMLRALTSAAGTALRFPYLCGLNSHTDGFINRVQRSSHQLCVCVCAEERGQSDSTQLQ